MAQGASRFAWMDDRVVPFEQAKIPIDDRGLLFAESLYEVIPVTGGKARMLPEHIGRMRAASEPIELGGGVPDDGMWEKIVGELVAHEQVEEGLLYAQLTGGSAPRQHLPQHRPRPRFFAYLLPFRFPRADAAARGIALQSFPDPRWSRCDLKTTMLLPGVLAKRDAVARGADEALFVGPDGSVREGASTNVFLVEDNRLITPLQNQHLLPGITRPLVGQLAAETGRSVDHETLPLSRLLKGSEVFVTSTTLLVTPVVRIDGQAIGDGQGGPVARELAQRLRARLDLRG
ncbi:MAG TPA: aminotransferase class IV [Polyangiaceae bacterium]|nr:aminotransferase class IV [Polyangiaceae bacterium]